ncbi:peptide MFS transporter [Streptomyces sp. NBC_01264]|uniref:peptide MFS transporter n=1 Tax=Streptomyces sp. NBC_01264 TaxID=2903804 RepID=UPI0022521B5E|nr:oligopeptide:H+ symporter [Streptomyces sp. NBC_01264]MCX4781797.1 oligopeptide:H+ symporter [Streptomyces sp. NBC_01264]
MSLPLTQPSPARPSASGSGFRGHPRGLATLFMTEMWERFSYYGMRALLVFYLISGGHAGLTAHLPGGGLGMTLAAATAVYSVYLAVVYLMTMPGGWFADRVWGARRTVAVGGVIIVIGHFVLAVPGTAAFLIGLALVAIGSGLLKANVSAMVGHLYPRLDDPRRDGGFTLFYVGINIGSLLAPLVIGTVGETVSWALAFILSGVGMALGLAQYLSGTKHLAEASSRVPHPLSTAERRSLARRTLAVLAVVAAFYTAVSATGHYTLTWALLPLTVIGLAVPVAVLVRMKRDRNLTADEQAKLRGYIWLFVAAAVFWMIYDQAGSTLLAFAKTSASATIGGFAVPGSWYQALNPVFIIVLAPVFVWLWLHLARRRRQASNAGKFGMGLLLIGVSFLVFLVPMHLASGGARVSPWWLVIIFLVQTLGELSLSPVGLSATTQLAPRKYCSQMMGVWFLAVTAGDSVTGLLSIAHVNLADTPAVAVEGAVAALAGLAVYLSRRGISRLMGSAA